MFTSFGTTTTFRQFYRDELLNFWQSQDGGLDLFLRGMDRYGQPSRTFRLFGRRFNLVLNHLICHGKAGIVCDLVR
jgi:hypothetical protein